MGGSVFAFEGQTNYAERLSSFLQRTVGNGRRCVTPHTADLFQKEKEARRIAVEEHLAKSRRDLARRAALPSSTDPDALLRVAQAAASARADAPLGSMGTTIGRVLPAAARSTAGLPVSNPKLWERDVKPLRDRKVNREAWLIRARQAARAREPGDVLQPILVRLAEVVCWAERKDGVGFARQTFEQLGKLVGCCKETARKGMRFLERHGLVDTFNVLTRAHGFVRRVANLYLIRGEATEPDGTEQPPSEGPLGRLTRYASAFGLSVRAWGLNATPASVGYRPRLERPVPS